MRRGWERHLRAGTSNHPTCCLGISPHSRLFLKEKRWSWPLQQTHCFRGPCDHIVDVAESVICAQESELVAGLLQEPHERCISPGGSRGETGLNYSSPNPNIGISANPNVRIRKKKILNSKNLILHFLCTKGRMGY